MLLATLLIAFLPAEATLKSGVKYVGCEPQSGSVIDHFNITYSFDLSELIKSSGDQNWYLCTMATYSENPYNTELWEGDPDTGKLIYRAYEYNTDPRTEDTQPGGKMTFTFGNIAPKPNTKYTVITRDDIYAVPSAYPDLNWITTDSYTVGYISLSEKSPIVNTFTGAEIPDTQCALIGFDNAWCEPLFDVSTITLHFNAPVTFIGKEQNIILQKSSPKASDTSKYQVATGQSVMVDSADPTKVTITFPKTSLDEATKYYVVIPEGTFANAANPESKSPALHTCLLGATDKLDDIGDFVYTNPVIDNLFFKVNVPEGYSMISSSSLKFKITGVDVPLQNVYQTITGELSQDKTGFNIPLELIRLLPDSEYKIELEDGKIRLQGERSGNFEFEGKSITFHTPTVEEFNAMNIYSRPNASWGDAFPNKYDYKNPVTIQFEDSYASVPSFYLALDPLKPSVVGSSGYARLEAVNQGMINLYEVTEAGDVLLKSQAASTVKVEDMTSYFYMAKISLNYKLLAGKEYKLVIEDGAYGLLCVNHCNYISYLKMPEYTIHMKGTSPTTVQIESCDIEDGAQLSEIGAVRLKLKSSATLKDNAKVYFSYTNALGSETKISAKILANTTTVVYADFSDIATGKPYALTKGREYQLVYEEGLLTDSYNPEIILPETRYKFTGIAKVVEPEKPAYETVKVSFSLNDGTTTSFDAIKDKELSISIVPDEWWILESLTVNGEDATGNVVNGIFTSAPLTNDASIIATLTYKEPLAIADESGVTILPDTEISVFNEGEDIVISGLSGQEDIVIYSISGQVIATHNAALDVVKISVPRGQTYIIRVNNFAVKLIH